MKKIAVTGSKGQIGRRLVSLGAIPFECSILDKVEIKREVHRVNPDLIIHAAALSKIDSCEKDYELALSVNVWGFNNLCDIVENGRMLLISSEQVFDGVSGNYKEDDIPNPINNYGHSKLGAEQVASLYRNKVIRLSRGFSNRIGSDVYKYVEELKKGKKIYVPDFIVRSYCHTDYMAEAIMYAAEHIEEMPLMLHLAGASSLSFFDLMALIGAEYVNSGLVNPRGEDDGKHSPRPFNCGLDVSRATHLRVPIHTVLESVERFMEEEPHA